MPQQILVVDDADSGEKALSLYDADQPPDLVLLDHLMPGKTGMEVAAELRALRVTPVSKVDHTALFRVIEAAATGSAPPAPSGTST